MPLVRFEMTEGLGRLGKVRPALMWEIAERIVEKDQSPGVVCGVLMNVLHSLSVSGYSTGSDFSQKDSGPSGGRERRGAEALRGVFPLGLLGTRRFRICQVTL